jgi:iron(III) transport system substrate-binding protein
MRPPATRPVGAPVTSSVPRLALAPPHTTRAPRPAHRRARRRPLGRLSLALALLCALAAACAPAAPTGAASKPTAAPARPPTAEEQRWQEVVAKARQEGAVSVIVAPGEQYRQGVQGFQAAYPGIELQVKGEHIRDGLARILQERDGGIYSQDVMLGAIGAGVFQEWIPRGVLAPLEPNVILPDARDDSKWADGFRGGWVDTSGQYVYGFLASASRLIYVNRDFISEQELPAAINLDTLLDPKWRGKIVWDDPRELGPGVNVAAAIIRERNESYLTRLIQEQEIVASRDPRQIVEWVVRGRYPIGVALNATILDGFQKEGLGKNVVPVDIKEINVSVPGFGAVSLFDKAPHPNAAVLFVNWLLSREGQDAYTSSTIENSRRLDVAPKAPAFAPTRGVEYTNLQKEDFAPLRARAAQVAQEAIR